MGWRVALVVLAGLGIGAALYMHAPIAQPSDYHHFADTRTMYRVPDALNVLSNLPFALVGLLGLRFLGRGPKPSRDPDDDPEARPGAHTAFISYRERPAYVLFFLGVFFTAFGSGYYHWAPSTTRLFWDRLPMSVAFMALFATVVAERIDVYWSRVLLLPLVALGIASVVWWRVGEDHGAGDLRLYLFVQGFPMVALPLMMLLFRARYTRSWELIVVVILYGIAKGLEHFDLQVWEQLQHQVSGHTLKHLVAALATYTVLDMLKHRSPAPEQEDMLEDPAVE